MTEDPPLPDHYQEWIDQMLIKEHEEHPERFARVNPSTPPPATPTTPCAEQKGVDGGG